MALPGLVGAAILAIAAVQPGWRESAAGVWTKKVKGGTLSITQRYARGEYHIVFFRRGTRGRWGGRRQVEYGFARAHDIGDAIKEAEAWYASRLRGGLPLWGAA